MHNLWRVIKLEIGLPKLRPRYLFFAALICLLPSGRFGRLRAVFYRGMGFSIGKKTIVGGSIHIKGDAVPSQLSIGSYCHIGPRCSFDLFQKITVGNNVVIAFETAIITATHDTSTPERRCGALEGKQVYIGDGAWIAARATLLPGVKIGAGAIVGAGAVVSKDVPPHCVVVGNPARIIRQLDGGEAIEDKKEVLHNA